MKALTEKLLHYLVLIVVTLVCVGVMWKLSAKEPLVQQRTNAGVRPLKKVAAQKAPVAIQPLQVGLHEITKTYAGKIQPWETYQIGFAVGGRVIALGENAAGKPLDEGDQVVAGQVLAQLDDRAFRAKKNEAAARVEQAYSELRRAEKVRQTRPNALSDAELQLLATDLALAEAQHEVALKNLDDATLKAPVNATISRRMIKPGESVNANFNVFELVENTDVLLVIDVPESHIRELEQRQRTIEENVRRQAEAPQDVSSPMPARAALRSPLRPLPEPGPPTAAVAQEVSAGYGVDTVFRAYVRLEGRDRFGKAWPTLAGEIHHIPEISDPRTGLFPVEIRLPNQERLLKPGMVATADVVTACLPGYLVPETAILFRQRSAHLFSVTRQQTRMEMLYWDVGPADIYRALQVPLTRWIEQGPLVFVPADQADLTSVVVRGQFRLADGQLVRVMNLDKFSPGEIQFHTATDVNVAAAPTDKGPHRQVNP